jgi:tetratricopeptide (TPR) repeat protein
MQKQKLLITFLIALCSLTLASQTCDKNLIEKKINKLEKKNYRTKSEQIAYADAYYELADCYKTSQDTSYKTRFSKAIKLYSNIFNHDPSPANKVYIIYKMGLAYFNSGDDTNAIIYFSKAIVANYPDPIVRYYKGICSVRLNKCAEAELEFNSYIKFTGDSVKAKDFLKQCNGK